MTLGEFLHFLNNNPVYIITYLLIIPFAAFLAGVMGKGEGHISPWKYLYAVLVYVVCIPGIFAITLNIYMFLFERRPIMDMQVYTQILPVFSMILTLWLIKRNVDLDVVPGFNKLSGFLILILALIGIMWFIDRVRLIVFSYMPIQYLLLLFVAFLLLIRYAWFKIAR